MWAALPNRTLRPGVSLCVEYVGDEQLVQMTRKDASLEAKLPVEQRVGPGDQLTFAVPRDKVYTFDAESEQRITS